MPLPSPDPVSAVAAGGATTFRDASLALGVAVLAYWLSCLLVPPSATVVVPGFGEDWEQMSRAPFDLVGQLPHRMLTPLLANLFGFTGPPHYVMFVRGLTIVMLATIFFFCRRRNVLPLDAALVTLAVAVTAPVQMYKQQWPGYVDPLSYALFFAAMLCARRPVPFWTLFLLNLLNHELAVFLLPWLWFVRRQAGGSWRADVAGAGVVVAAYGGFYLLVRAVAQPRYAADYFLQHPLLPWGAICTNMLAVVHWTVAFGPVLAVLAWHQHTRANGRERLHLWLVWLGIAAILSIAYDVSRHANLLVLPLVIAAGRFLQATPVHRWWFAAVILVTVVLLWLLPPWGQYAWPTIELLDKIQHTGVLEDFSRVITRWLPAVWPLLATLYGILAVFWFAGAWRAWRGRTLAGSADAAAPVR